MWRLAGWGTWAIHLVQCFSKWQNQLGCLISHWGIIGFQKYAIVCAEAVQKDLLDPVLTLEQTLNTTDNGAWCSKDDNMSYNNFILEKWYLMRSLEDSYSSLSSSVKDIFCGPPVTYVRELLQWKTCLDVSSWAVAQSWCWLHPRRLGIIGSQVRKNDIRNKA